MKKYIVSIFFVGVIVAMALVAFLAGVYSQRSDNLAPVALQNNQELANNAPIDRNIFINIAEKINPVVVNINTAKVVRRRSPFNNDPLFQDFFERFFGRDYNQRGQAYRSQSLGSGFIISADGYILTNNHVISDADEISVRLYNGRQYDGKIIGRDPETDVGLIKIDAQDLPYAALADSDNVRVGEWVIAIGNPFGLSHTVTTGIISAQERAIGHSTYDNYLQTDASINPGNSGGPLLNLQGQVIGINSAIVQNAYGIGFAVPINMAKALLPQLKTGKVQRGWLGVNIQDIDDEMRQALGLDADYGVIVPQVVAGAPAEKAGIKAGDIILKINGRKMESANQLATTIAAIGPGNDVDITIQRESRVFDVSVTLAERRVDARGQILPDREPEKTFNAYGLVLSPLNPLLRRQYSIPESVAYGLVVTGLDPEKFSASGVDLQLGDVVVEVNREKIEKLADFEAALSRGVAENKVLLRIFRQDTSYYVIIRKK